MNKSNLNGYWLIPLLHFIAIAIAIYFIWLYRVDDFTNQNAIGITQFYWAVAFAVGGCIAFLMTLYCMNLFLAKSVSLYLFAILFIISLVSILTWVDYLKTGEVDFLGTISKLIGY